MYKVSRLFAILCAIGLVSCGGGSPQGIIEEYYTHLKNGDYEKAAETVFNHFEEAKDLDKAEIGEHQEELISLKANDLMKEVAQERLPKEFTIIEVTTDDGGAEVKVREIYSDNDFDRVYRFAKEDGKWVVVAKKYVSETGRGDAWYHIKEEDAKVTLYTAPDTESEVGGHITINSHIKGFPTKGAFKVQKTDIEGWSTVVKDIWEFNHTNAMGVYKGDITYYVNRTELTENAEPER